jgi:tetratricopeptide (TPR) repeat protein
MTDKLDKKELEEPDKLQLFFITLRAFAQQHKTRIYVGAGVLLLIVLLASGWTFYQLNYETSAGKIFSNIADTALKAGSPAGDEAAIKGYKELIAQYPRSRAALTAHYRLGNLYFSRRDFDAALIVYQEFLNRAPADNELVTLAYNVAGTCYEAKADFKKALEYYEKALKANPSDSFATLHFRSIGRVYEQMNDAAKAVEFYRKALEKTSDPLMTLYLKRKIALLG